MECIPEGGPITYDPKSILEAKGGFLTENLKYLHFKLCKHRGLVVFVDFNQL